MRTILFDKLQSNNIFASIFMVAGIAQLVEQWTENPRVTSSNLVPGIKNKIQIPILG